MTDILGQHQPERNIWIVTYRRSGWHNDLHGPNENKHLKRSGIKMVECGSLPLQRKAQDGMNMNHLLSVRFLSINIMTSCLSKDKRKQADDFSFGRNGMLNSNFVSDLRYGLLTSF